MSKAAEVFYHTTVAPPEDEWSVETTLAEINELVTADAERIGDVVRQTTDAVAQSTLEALWEPLANFVTQDVAERLWAAATEYSKLRPEDFQDAADFAELCQKADAARAVFQERTFTLAEFNRDPDAVVDAVVSAYVEIAARELEIQYLRPTVAKWLKIIRDSLEVFKADQERRVQSGELPPASLGVFVQAMPRGRAEMINTITEQLVGQCQTALITYRDGIDRGAIKKSIRSQFAASKFDTALREAEAALERPSGLRRLAMKWRDLFSR